MYLIFYTGKYGMGNTELEEQDSFTGLKWKDALTSTQPPIRFPITFPPSSNVLGGSELSASSNCNVSAKVPFCVPSYS